MTDTEAILDNARYLRHVRPIDPEEIRQYVPDRPHPAVVRETLRESALELGLRERPDGTFVPAADDPVDPAFDGVDVFPERYDRILADRLLDRYGPDWPTGGGGDRLRERIDELKAAYFADEPVTYDADTALAYAVYHLPDTYAAIQYVLADLARDGLLPGTLRVLDVGAGPGGPALGLHDVLPGESLVSYRAVEPSENAAVLAAMLEATRPSFTWTIDRETVESYRPPTDPIDLLLFGNVLAELDEPAAVLERSLEWLAEDGTVLVLSPAEERTATRLRRIERAVCERRPDVTVYAPTVRLWPGESPADRGWTFRREPDLEPPATQRRLDEAAEGDGTYLNVDVQFAYLLLRTDGRRAIDVDPAADRYAKMAEMERHVTDRIDLLAVKLSPDLADDGNPVFKVGDGSESVDHYAVLTRPSGLNEALLEAPYGGLLRFENVLVLWNDDEAAYNLVVDDETVVDRLR